MEEVVVAAVVVGEVAGEVALDGVDSAQGGGELNPSVRLNVCHSVTKSKICSSVYLFVFSVMYCLTTSKPFASRFTR